MNAPLYAVSLLRLGEDKRVSLPLATPGVQRYVWESRFGKILIEVIGEQTFVNGQVVEPMSSVLQGQP